MLLGGTNMSSQPYRSTLFYILMRRKRGCQLIYRTFHDFDLPAGTILHDITPETKVLPEAAYKYPYVISLDDPDNFLPYNLEYLEIIDRNTAEHLMAITKIYQRISAYEKKYAHIKNAMQIQLGDCVIVNASGYELTGKLRYKGSNGILPGTWFGVELDQVIFMVHVPCFIQTNF